MTADRIADVLVIGGGINGAGIARDAAGRGLKVTLVEQGDLAGATSSASTKLIHGGLRYLEYYEFRLVREALIERELLLALAPHLIRPLQFVLPHARGLRPVWLIRLGLLLYDGLRYGPNRRPPVGERRSRLPRSRAVDLRREPEGQPLHAAFARGFAYADCWVEDSRLVVLNAMDAAERGATVLTRTRCVAARRQGGVWEATLADARTGERRPLRSRALVNATGPWATTFIEQVLRLGQPHRLRLIKGSHIVVPKLYEGEHAYILQNRDRRIVFAIPYERRFTLIGTTDVDFAGDPSSARISPAEIDYLCDVINRHFVRNIAPGDVVWTYAGVRPLYDNEAENAAAVTRAYTLELEGSREIPPLLNIFGGKITTYRKLAEHALEKLAPFFPQAGGPWTAAAALPGGDMKDADFNRFLADVQARRAWLPPGLALRYARAYGTRIDGLLGSASTRADLGRHFGEDLYEREVAYLMAEEWAQTAEDILWRRSKLGLHLSPSTQANLEDWLSAGALRARTAAQ